MRKLGKHIAQWLLPAGLYRGLSDWRSRPKLSNAERAILELNAGLRNRHAGERCFILATGPSVGLQDLKFLKDEICIAVSNFIVHSDFDVIRPDYYCIAPRHDPITEEQWIGWLANIEQRNPYSRFFMGLTDRELNKRHGLFQERVNYLRFHRSCPNSVSDLTKTLAPPQSVSVMALMVAVYMQFSEIYLLGCDHSWILHIGKASHFYSEDQHKMVELGFDEWFEDSPMEKALLAYLNLWRQYKFFLKSEGAYQIFNLSPESLLDLFPRKNLEDVAPGGSG